VVAEKHLPPTLKLMATRELIPHLELIAAARRQYVIERKSQTPIEAVRALASMQKRPLPVLTTVPTHEQAPVTLIAQVRVAAGDGAELESLAQHLMSAGADALSLFTDKGLQPHGLDDLVALTRAVNLPIISQDVFVDEYQIVEARAAGASALVLRASTMENDLLRTLVSTTQRNRMTAIVEVNSFEEVAYAQSLSPYVIAISQIDAWTGEASDIPAADLRTAITGTTRVILAESLATLDDIQSAVDLQVDAVIVEPDFLLNPLHRKDLHHLLRRSL
jgi:indole-3-glycerol phosphate synthase